MKEYITIAIIGVGAAVVAPKKQVAAIDPTPIQTQASQLDSDIDTVDIYAGRNETTEDKTYGPDGQPLHRSWLTRSEWRGEHISDKATRSRFHRWKANEIDKFVKQISALAAGESKRCGYKIPASLIAAQAILESNFGKSRVCGQANNYFGHKYRGNSNNYVVAHDDSPDDKFTKFRSRWHSIRAHSEMLLDPNWIYQPRMVGKKPTLSNWLTALCISQNVKASKRAVRKGGSVYATSCYTSCYACKIKSVVRKYGLKKLDKY